LEAGLGRIFIRGHRLNLNLHGVSAALDPLLMHLMSAGKRHVGNCRGGGAEWNPPLANVYRGGGGLRLRLYPRYVLGVVVRPGSMTRGRVARGWGCDGVAMGGAPGGSAPGDSPGANGEPGGG
jgi:hypothetical protein